MNSLILKQIIGNIIPDDIRKYIIHSFIYAPKYTCKELQIIHDTYINIRKLFEIKCSLDSTDTYLGTILLDALIEFVNKFKNIALTELEYYQVYNLSLQLIRTIFTNLDSSPASLFICSNMYFKINPHLITCLKRLKIKTF